MTNGMGAGFAAISMLAVLAGLALLVMAATAVFYAVYRRSGQGPTILRYLLAAASAGVVGVSGFGIAMLYDEATILAGLLALVALAPFVLVGIHLNRTTGLARLDVIVTTVMAWGLTFLIGVVVTFGTMEGIGAALDLSQVELRRMGIGWVASTAGGLTILLGMLILSRRLRGMMDTTAGRGERV